jgi:hypothetical protein
MANGSLKRVAQKQAQSLPAETSEIKKITRAQKEPEDQLWNFSLRYWSQLEYFGLDGKGIDNQWLVSVLERLKQLSADTIERVFKDANVRDALRFHPINWKAKNIPIKLDEIPSLPKHCYDNPEFALHQFQISTAKGRVVGFFDENWIFNIVLLDPLHNLQPSRNFDYAVDPCGPLSCQITSLREGIKQGIAHCEVAECKAARRVKALAHQDEQHAEQFEILMIKVTDREQLEWAKELVANGHAESLASIFETGLLTIDESVIAKA